MKFKNKNIIPKIAFLCPYPYDTVGGQRFRYEQYLGILSKEGIKYKILSFYSHSTFTILYKQGFFFRKLVGVILGYFRRLSHLFLILPCTHILIYRELTPLGYPVYEWVIAKVLRKKIIYDFDDAIWLQPTSVENKIISWLKYPKKVGLICGWSYKVSAGNKYLRDYALKYNRQAFINPTTIDTSHHHNLLKNQNSSEIVIGWTGTHSTLVYLEMIYPVLKKLDEKYDFTFQVIADKEVQFDLAHYRFTKWRSETEISDLMNFNIGIMPLTEDEWSEGKCGFKALQYMALGIPAVVSAVGVNSQIVTNNQVGFLCSLEDEWYQKLAILIEDMELRVRLGKAARERVVQNYSVDSNTENFLSLFK